jgi:hypothetical protein
MDLLFRGMSFKKSDIFTHIYQDLISISNRQTLGEFYTPHELVVMMINRKFNDQKSILDPSCGSGSFLIEILKKLNKRNTNQNYEWGQYRIYGIDLNPIAVQVCYFNIILYLESAILEPLSLDNIPHISIYQSNALYPTSDVKKEIRNIELIIGNPPWINLSGLISDDYKIKLKQTARNLRILLGIEAKNTEICSIFFYQCRNLYLIEGGEIFFVLPASILNGRQHVFFRYFYNFDSIEVWRFTHDIFKVHNVCIYAQNITLDEISESEMKLRLNFNSILFDVKNQNSQLKFIEKYRENLVPAFIKWDENFKFPRIGRYNPEDKYDQNANNIYPSRSEYYEKIRGGLRIVPRRWVVIKDRPPFSSVTKIHPDMSQQAKVVWSIPPYEEVSVESEYVHPFLKSQGLIPFTFARIDYAFMPISFLQDSVKNRIFFNTENMKPNAKKFYTLLDSEYRKMIKQSASMKTLADNFTYNGRLIPSLSLFKNSDPQLGSFILVHNSIGSIVKAAVINDPILLDNSLYFFISKKKNEVYYLAGVLNSSLMTKLVKKIGSTGSRGSLRNIHKNPYNFPIPLFKSSKIQIKIAEMAENLEFFVKKFILSNININPDLNLKKSKIFLEFLVCHENKIKVRTIQSKLLKNETYQALSEELNLRVITLFQKS